MRADLTLPTPRPGDTDQPQFTEEESQASKGNLVFSAARYRARPVWHRTRDRTRDALSNPGTNSARSGWRIRPTDTGVEAQGGAELSLYRTTGGKSTARFPELPRRPTRQTAVRVIGKSPCDLPLHPARLSHHRPQSCRVHLSVRPSHPERRGLFVAAPCRQARARASPASPQTQAGRRAGPRDTARPRQPPGPPLLCSICDPTAFRSGWQNKRGRLWQNRWEPRH